MPCDARAYLWDIRDAGLAIQSLVVGLDAPTYAANALVHSSVERKFEIIGEALKQLAKTHPNLAKDIPRLPEIVAFRNQLIHGYATVAHARV